MIAAAVVHQPPMRPFWRSVAVVGTGLIGGSIGRCLLSRRLAGRVVGIGRSEATLREARKLGAVTDTSLDVAAGVADADLVVVATGVGSIPAVLEAVDAAARPGTLLTDAGSTKARIAAAWARRKRRRARFVPAHPIAGSHRRGPAAADERLFEGRITVLTPAASTPKADVEAVGEFWASLGSTVYVTTPKEHDRILATTSHAPHVLAAAIAATTKGEQRRFTAGGWRDTTRIASGDPELWADILLDNAANVGSSLARIARYTERLLAAIETGNRRQLVALLEKGKEARDAVGTRDAVGN